MEELMQVIKGSSVESCESHDVIMQLDREEGQLPLLLSLASEERGSFVMENLELVAEPAMLVRVVQVLEQEEVKFTFALTFSQP